MGSSYFNSVLIVHLRLLTSTDLKPTLLQKSSDHQSSGYSVLYRSILPNLRHPQMQANVFPGRSLTLTSGTQSMYLP